ADEATRLRKMSEALSPVSEGEPVRFPAHPRSLRRLRELQLEGSLGAAHVVPPLPYRSFLALMASARAVVTDSGGVQEETTALGVPCLTLRANTERPVTITEGTNQLVEAEPESFRRALDACNGRRHRVPEL